MKQNETEGKLLHELWKDGFYCGPLEKWVDNCEDCPFCSTKAKNYFKREQAVADIAGISLSFGGFQYAEIDEHEMEDLEHRLYLILGALSKINANNYENVAKYIRKVIRGRGVEEPNQIDEDNQKAFAKICNLTIKATTKNWNHIIQRINAICWSRIRKGHHNAR